MVVLRDVVMGAEGVFPLAQCTLIMVRRDVIMGAEGVFHLHSVHS